MATAGHPDLFPLQGKRIDSIRFNYFLLLHGTSQLCKKTELLVTNQGRRLAGFRLRRRFTSGGTPGV